MDGKNIRFEELPCKDQELSFEILHRKLKEIVRIENFDKDTLKTLNLYDDENGFNNAAGLLADKTIFLELILSNSEKTSVSFKRDQLLKIYRF